MLDNPHPDLATVRRLIEPGRQGLQAFHRLEMVHQDLKPDNIMIDSIGTVNPRFRRHARCQYQRDRHADCADQPARHRICGAGILS